MLIKNKRLSKRKKQKERLEEAVLGFIEDKTEKSSTETNMKILPQMIHELIELWKL